MVGTELKLLIASAIAATADFDALVFMVDSSAETSAIVISLEELSDKKKRRRNETSLMYFPR